MLFSSVGFMKVDAQISITLPKTKEAEDVTITFTSSEKKFKPKTSSDKGSYPMIGDDKPTVSEDGATATYKFKTKTDVPTSLEIAKGFPEAASNSWGEITLTLNGKVSSFGVTANPTKNEKNVLNYITSLSFTNNGELSTLELCKSNGYLTTGLPKLASLSCDGNKLNYIPSKLGDDGKVKLTTYNVGEQSPSSTMFTPVNVAEPKKGLTLTTSLFDKGSTKIFGQTVTGALTISELKDKDDKVVNYAKSESGKYFFKDGDIFMDGEFTAKIAVGSDDKNYPDVVICGVPVKVNAATFILDKANKITIEPKNAGTINVTEPEDSKLNSLTRNTVVKLTPASNSGYEFDKFEIVAGLEAAGQDGNSYSFKVEGDKDPEIKAIFKAKGATVTYNTPDAAQGTLRVTKAENNELVASGNTVPVGTKLLITAKAKDGYQVEDGNVSFKMADKSGALTPGPEEDKKDASEKTWTYEVTIDGLDVQAAFTALTYSLKNASSTPKITITDTKGVQYVYGNDGAWENIPVNTELIFTCDPDDDKVVSSVVINSKSYEVTQMQDGKFTWKGFVMPNEESSMTVTLSELKSITVNLVKNKFAYNGQEQKVDFSVDKNVDKTSFTVEYKEKTADAKTYTEKAFANEGEYTVRITRPADGVYAACKEEFEYTIDQAQLIVEAPTVEYKDGKFVFAGGAAYFMNGDKKVDVDGKFVALNDGGSPLSEDEMADYNDKTEVKVNYSFDNANVKGVDNFMLSYGDAVESATIKSVGTNALTFSLKSTATTSSSSALLADGAKVSVGSTIMFSWDEIEGLPSGNYAVYQADANGEKLDDTPIEEYTIQKGDKELYFLLEVKDKRTELALSDQAKKYIQEGKFEYEAGKKVEFTFNKNSSDGLYFVNNEGEVIVDDNLYSPTYFSITYWKKNGGQVAEAIDAGDYQVKIARKASPSYKEFEEVTLDFTINPDDIPESIDVPTPTASMIGKGQTLGTSKLSGNAEIAGEYCWDDGNNKIVNATKWFSVTFYPEDKNYKPKQIKAQVEVKVSDKPILTITCDETKGTVEVSDSDNNYYYDGDAIDVNSLRFVAKAKDGYTFESYSFIHGGTPTTVKNSDYTTTPNRSSIDVVVNFKEKSAEAVYHTVSFTSLNVAGASLNVAGVVFNNVSTSNKVKEGDSFNFSMSAHPSDYSRIAVIDNKGKSYAVSSGACTIDNVQEDLQLTVSLSNPTKYNVTLSTEYEDSEGNLMGTANFSGNTYHGGTITLKAVPKEGYKFVGWLNAGTTSTATTVQVTVTSNMTISARFESDGTIDPNTECIIRTPYDEDLTGVSINKQGVNVVKIGSDFEFTVDAYEDDLKNVKVTVDGAELKPTTGNKYVISKVKKNTEVKVTLDNPTRIKVVIEKETKNAKGYVMGHVDVDVVDFGTYYPDSTCYYNTKLRLAAYPESGVEFKNWSDVTSNTDLIREITVTDNVTIKPVFEGTPTGIEDIMAASIATGKGCVWVRGIANADVTIVSIAGRVQARQRISGDTRIDVPAGIYVVVLESGSDVKRVKVIVK